VNAAAEVAAMRRALALGRRALGGTSPNPPVGCVVLDPAGSPIGEGHTCPPGGPAVSTAVYMYNGLTRCCATR